MPELTRRRSAEHRHECWHVYYGDVHAGTIAIRAGIPFDEDPWGWACGFYPGSHPGECTNGAAATFDQARADFEGRVVRIPLETNGGRFPGVARSAGLDRREVPPL
jgi:hypothetical protein